MTALARTNTGLASKALPPIAEPRFETRHSGTESFFLRADRSLQCSKTVYHDCTGLDPLFLYGNGEATGVNTRVDQNGFVPPVVNFHCIDLLMVFCSYVDAAHGP